MKPYVTFVLALTILALLFYARFSESPWGHAMRAVRDSETASLSIGLDPTLLRTTAFAVSAIAAGIAGGVFAALNNFISPESFPFFQSILFLLVVMLGGAGGRVEQDPEGGDCRHCSLLAGDTGAQNDLRQLGHSDGDRPDRSYEHEGSCDTWEGDRDDPSRCGQDNSGGDTGDGCAGWPEIAEATAPRLTLKRWCLWQRVADRHRISPLAV
jgi:hypothetical protein